MFRDNNGHQINLMQNFKFVEPFGEMIMFLLKIANRCTALLNPLNTIQVQTRLT